MRVGDAEGPGVPDGSFDAVTCGFGIFFLPDALAALAAWRRALRPGGTVAISTFLGVGGWEWIKPVAERLMPELAGRPAFTHPQARSAGSGLRWPRPASPTSARPTSAGGFVFPDLDAGHRAPEGGYELVQGAEATVATAP